MPGSPKKKKMKWKATESDLKAPEGQEGLVKRVHAQADDQADESQHRRCSGRPGAGKGGRGTQLEKIGAILHAQVWTNQAKGATSLDLNVPANPLAPEPPRKGRKSHSKNKQPPPPYSPSETLHATTSKSRSKNKIPIAPTLSLQLLNDQPTFAQCEAGGQYGFSPPIVSIVPPGTEPDLQAPASEAHHLTNAPHITDPVPSRTTSTTATLSDTTFYDNLNPALWLSSPLGADSEESDTSKDEETSGLDGGSEDRQIGWGEVGFSREELPSQPQVVTALPTDFEFQHT
ncbi:hypothetical protein DFJ58DRAFT_726393 [Suillus subalutaceus]|uniref:uncharacterized protein n=1 Tax=Suillus subalutaceus TaxID=48586 RepID=UPI001B87795D|nr:uncharacterized protein DFJ58DRAFT_726393 [Suillus subalutaceus]KAG1859370.1 hypothetical protein DFJ58DRAFT_726393 [Suillus subalutaceus]